MLSSTTPGPFTAVYRIPFSNTVICVHFSTTFPLAIPNLRSKLLRVAISVAVVRAAAKVGSLACE